MRKKNVLIILIIFGIIIGTILLSGCLEKEKQICNICNGTGKCPWCNGSGWEIWQIDKCDHCDGTGTCPNCHGTGKIE